MEGPSFSPSSQLFDPYANIPPSLQKEPLLLYDEIAEAFNAITNSPNKEAKFKEIFSKNKDIVHCTDHQGKTLLHLAVIAADFEMVKILLQYNFEINKKDGIQKTPLYYSITSKKIDMIKALLDKGANIEDDEHPILHEAAAEKESDILDVLLLRNPDVNKVNPNKETPLHCAAKKGNEKNVDLLIKHGATVNIQNIGGNTPFHFAAQNGYLTILKLLINNKAQVDCKNNLGKTALHAAATAGNEEIINFLLNYGAKKNMDSKDRFGRTALHLAILHKHSKIVEILLKHGANPNAQTKFNETPLHLASENNASDIVKLLLKYHADITIKSNKKETALDIATTKKYTQIEQLLQNHCLDSKREIHEVRLPMQDLITFEDVNIVDQELGGPLHYAIKNEKNIESLLKQGIDTNSRDIFGYTPLHLAVQKEDLSTISLLLSYGADASIQCENGNTPLHFAAEKGQVDIVKILLNHHFTIINFVDNRSRTALHFAVLKGHAPVVKVLLLYTADVDRKTSDDKTALNLAIENNNEEIKNLILHHVNQNTQIPDSETTNHPVKKNDPIKKIKDKAFRLSRHFIFSKENDSNESEFESSEKSIRKIGSDSSHNIEFLFQTTHEGNNSENKSDANYNNTSYFKNYNNRPNPTLSEDTNITNTSKESESDSNYNTSPRFDTIREDVNTTNSSKENKTKKISLYLKNAEKKIKRLSKRSFHQE